MDSIWKDLPYDLVRVIIDMAGLSHDAMRYIRFSPPKLKHIPYINFPICNLMQKFTDDDKRIVVISNKERFSFRMYDNTHNNFPQPDRSITYERSTGSIRATETLYDPEKGEYVEYSDDYFHDI